MKRMKRIIAFCCIFVMAASGVTFATPIDVQYHWSGTAVNTLIEHGVMKGYPNSRFRPDKKITREEAASIIYSYIQTSGNTESGDSTKSFSDVKSTRWSYKAISFLASHSILNGYKNGKFLPTKNLTREEFAVIADRCMMFLEDNPPIDYPLDEEGSADEIAADPSITATPEAINETPGAVSESETSAETSESAVTDDDNTASTAITKWAPFWDIKNSYALMSIHRLYDQGIISGYSNGSFRPKNPITRAETASMIYKITAYPAIKPTITIPTYKKISVPYISQVYPVYAPVGCEGTSLLMGLKAKGYAKNTTLTQFLDAMPKHWSNPAKGFVGTPYRADPTKTLRTTIYPAKLAQYGSSYGKVYNISGYSPHELQAEVLAGNPVVAYCTLWWEKPYYRYYNIEGTTQRLLSNNHVILVCGYDRKTNYYYIADPYNVNNRYGTYFYWISGSTFDKIYKERYHAVVVQ